MCLAMSLASDESSSRGGSATAAARAGFGRDGLGLRAAIHCGWVEESSRRMPENPPYRIPAGLATIRQFLHTKKSCWYANFALTGILKDMGLTK
jgi:hypothetical protein